MRFRRGQDQWEADDPYRFPPLLTEIDLELLAEGNHLKLYEILGAQPRNVEGVDGVGFAVWAPNALRVSVIGDFNAWDGRRHPMRRRHRAGIWEIFIPGLWAGIPYKFELLGADGKLLPQKADPVAFRQEHPPATASIVHGPVSRSAQVEGWVERRKEANALDAPISIYEVHLGSWRRGPTRANS